MSDINEIHNVTIVNNNWGIAYSQLIDTLKPKSATACYICVNRFDAVIDLPANYASPCHLLALFIPGVETCHINDPHSNVVVRSHLVETFWSSQLTAVTAIHHSVSQSDNWIKINHNDLNDFRIIFRTADLEEFISPISYIPIQNFPFSLHLKVKFQ